MTTVLHLVTTPISLEWLLAPQLEAFREAGYRVVTASAPGPEARRLAGRSADHHSLPAFTRDMNIGSDLRAASQFRKLLAEVRPEIVHTHNPKPGVIGRVVSKWANVPIVVNTVHGLYAQPTDRFSRRAVVYGLERIAAAHSDAELIQSVEDVDTLRSLGVPDERLHLLGNGIDLDEFSPSADRARAGLAIRAELGISPTTPVVGIVGRLVWEKGYAEFFAAVEQLREHFDATDLEFIVVGPDAERPGAGVDAELRDDLAARFGVHFLGTRNDVASVLSAFDIFALPSYREGFPRAAMEASAMGLPVVASNIRGCRQVVDHERTGLLVGPRNAGELTAAIHRLVEAPRLRQEMGRCARQRAGVEFDQQRVIDRTLAVYRTLLERRGLPVPNQSAEITLRYNDSIDLVDLDASNRADASRSAVAPSDVRKS